MSEIENKIREEARKALESNEVALVIGWGEGSVPFKTTPVFVEKADDVGKLVWNEFCVNNLAVYLPKIARDRRVGIVAKPCDIRSIVTLIQEKQVKRENVFIIGLGCGGVVDATGPDASTPRQMCLVCKKREPAIYDVIIGEAVPLEESRANIVPELPEERQKYWVEQFSKCIRCYACRQICPACYCRLCFADRVEPRWTSRKATVDEAWMFHATRVMHLAGRCIQCGECERVCPVGVPVAELAREMAEVIKENYNYEAGDPKETAPVLGQFRENDVDPAQHIE